MKPRIATANAAELERPCRDLPSSFPMTFVTISGIRIGCILRSSLYQMTYIRSCSLSSPITLHSLFPALTFHTTFFRSVWIQEASASSKHTTKPPIPHSIIPRTAYHDRHKVLHGGRALYCDVSNRCRGFLEQHSTAPAKSGPSASVSTSWEKRCC